jgi:hypothetical protein
MTDQFTGDMEFFREVEDARQEVWEMQDQTPVSEPVCIMCGGSLDTIDTVFSTGLKDDGLCSWRCWKELRGEY